MRRRSRIDTWEPDPAFVDRQLRGPYRLSHHRHEFEATGDGTRVRDVVHYALPLGLAGEAAQPVERRDLIRIFDYRQRAVRAALRGER